MKKWMTSMATLVSFLVFAGMAIAMSDTASHTVTAVVPDIAVIDILPASPNLTLTLNIPTSGDDENISSNTNTSDKLAYISIVPSGTVRKITASITSGALQAGLRMNLVAGTPGGVGARGTPTGGINFTSVTTGGDLITGVGSGWTGNAGSVLSYTLWLDDPTGVIQTSNVLTIEYTLTEAQ